jgi:hypothetical protein
MSDDTAFMEKLENLYKEYAPDMSHLPTADQIVSGLRFPESDMTVDEQVNLLNEVIELIEETYNKYNKKVNPLITSQINNFFRFLLTLNAEYAIFGVRLLGAHKKIAFNGVETPYFAILMNKYQDVILSKAFNEHNL